MAHSLLTARTWLNLLEAPDGPLRQVLHETYGTDDHVVGERLALLRGVVGRFLERFGDTPIRLFRAPGRINLRGMHVDTHGGFLNLMTHQREVVVAAGVGDSASVFINTDPSFEEVSFDIRHQDAEPGPAGDWVQFIMSPAIRAEVESQRGHWSHYLKGAMASAWHHCPEMTRVNLHAAISSDLPRGAALSSSAALCTALVQATLAVAGHTIPCETLIQAAQDAEWYTGSRCGLSDQAAVILGKRGGLVNLTIQRGAVNLDVVRHTAFPDELRILVANSYTERSLSGSARIEYTKNRFAYSLAMHILQQEARSQGCPENVAEGMTRLAGLSPAHMESVGGTRFLLRLLRSIPETISITELRTRYQLPNLDEAYDQYFGTAAASERPTQVALRGPLLFGIAESERARRFIDLLAEGDYVLAGRLMTIGHDGDRRVDSRGTPYSTDVSDAALDAAVANDTPIEMLPGAYGASSPVLDNLVDTALEAGALGASLTGAGIAGAVLALCTVDRTEIVGEALRNRLSSAEYAGLARRQTPLAEHDVADAVVTNFAAAPAGEICL